MEEENKIDDKAYHKKKVQEFKKAHKEQGLCVYCNEKAEDKKTMCKRHLEYHRFYKQFREKKKAEQDGNRQE